MSRQQRRQRRLTSMRRAQARQTGQQRRQSRGQLRRWLYLGVIGTIGLIIILGLALPAGLGRSTPRERLHVDLGDVVDYDTSPPNSGPHYGFTTASWGISQNPIQNEVQVHNLEHGDVIVQYNTTDTDLIDQLEALISGRSNYPSCYIVAPYPFMDRTIALTAWGVIQYLDEYDEQAILDFIDAQRDRAPETGFCAP